MAKEEEESNNAVIVQYTYDILSIIGTIACIYFAFQDWFELFVICGTCTLFLLALSMNNEKKIE